MRRLHLVVPFAIGLLVTACGGIGGNAGGARAAAESFTTAVQQQDFATACDLLAPETKRELESSQEQSCDQALGQQELDEEGGVSKAEVYGRSGRAMVGTDTIFLSRFPNGWRVTAAGCRPREDLPYECELQGA